MDRALRRSADGARLLPPGRGPDPARADRPGPALLGRRDSGARPTRAGRDGSNDPADLSPPVTTDDPSRLAAWAEFHHAIESLCEADRELFDLLWYQGLTQAEAAAVLGLSERTVHSPWLAARVYPAIVSVARFPSDHTREELDTDVDRFDRRPTRRVIAALGRTTAAGTRRGRLGFMRHSPELVAELRRRIEAVCAIDSALDTRNDREPRRRPEAGSNGRLPDVLRAAAVYRPQRHHAHGGLGEVLTAYQEELDRKVALKRIRPDKLHGRPGGGSSERPCITARLQHPGIVPIYDLGHDDEGPFYTMPFIEGETLQEAIEAFHAAESLRRDLGQRTLNSVGCSSGSSRCATRWPIPTTGGWCTAT